MFSKRKCPRGRQWWLVIALSVLLVWFPNVAAQEASPIPIGEEAISAVACTSTVYGGNPISVRVDLSAPAFRPYNMRLTPSLPRLFEMHQDGTIGWLLYSVGDTIQAAQVPTIAVPDDALVQITFDLFPSGYISPDVLSTATCDVFIIGTHDPTPTPTIAGESPTPAPTRTPVATATVPPGSPLRLLRAQTGSRSGSPSRVSVCLCQEPAPIGGLTVHLASSRPLTIPVPATIAISQGRDCKSLIVTPATVRTNTPVILTASLGPVTLAATTMVRTESTGDLYANSEPGRRPEQGHTLRQRYCFRPGNCGDTGQRRADGIPGARRGSDTGRFGLQVAGHLRRHGRNSDCSDGDGDVPGRSPYGVDGGAPDGNGGRDVTADRDEWISVAQVAQV